MPTGPGAGPLLGDLAPARGADRSGSLHMGMGRI